MHFRLIPALWIVQHRKNIIRQFEVLNDTLIDFFD